MSTTDFPEGVGQITVDKIKDDWFNNRMIVKMITEDKRYNPIVHEKESYTKNVRTNITDKTFCITGTLSKPRKHYEKIITDNGGILASVSGKLDYLVVGTDAGSKLDKAKKLGINIITEDLK